MKSSSLAVLAVSLLAFSLSASAREMVLPAGTLLKCTMDEPNLSSATLAIGDPVLCHLHSVTEFGQQTFPRGSYLIGHLESAEEPGHFWGKGYLKLQFDRIGLPQGDIPLDSKVIATHGYKVDKDGDIRGKGHAKRDIVEWMLPPLWPWKIIMLPARGPRPTLKGESQLTLRLMDDVQIPQVQASNGPDWHFFGRPDGSSGEEQDNYYQQPYHPSSYNGSNNAYVPQLAVRHVTVTPSEAPRLEEVSDVSDAPGSVSSAASPHVSLQVSPMLAISKDAIGGGGVSSGVPIFILKSGMTLAVGNYTYQDGRISYELASGGSGVISTDEVDWTATTRINSQRGVRVMLRGGHPNAESGL